MNTLGIRSEACSDRYLGLMVHIGRSRVATFAYLKDRMWQRLQGWLEKALSKAGKEVLSKACAQAIPIFAMSCFDLTKGLCEELNSMICRYWWSQMQNENKMHWLKWEIMTKPKGEGGLGYKDLHMFNLSMLAKQACRLLTNPSSLCAQFLKGRYYSDTEVIHAEVKNGISYAWRSILKGIEIETRSDQENREWQ